MSKNIFSTKKKKFMVLNVFHYNCITDYIILFYLTDNNNFFYLITTIL